jgi:hypothetical protein
VHCHVKTGRDHSTDLGVDVRVTSECIFGNLGGRMWTGCVLLRIWTSGRLL